MTTKMKTVLGILGFAAFIIIAYFAYTNISENYAPMKGAPEQENADSTASPKGEDDRIAAPDFTVYDADGNAVKLSDFKGKPVVLNFWASWCPPCRNEMPGFNKVYENVKDDVVFMMVDLVDGQRETQAKGQAYVDDEGFSFPVYFDTEQDAAYTYRISSIPTTFFIDSEGYISNAYQGGLEQSTVEDEISLIINK